MTERTRLIYNLGLEKLKVKLNALNLEYKTLDESNPIEHIKFRFKTDISIKGKLERKEKFVGKHLEYTDENIKNYIKDVIGARIVCPFIDDVYKIKDLIKASVEESIVKSKGVTQFRGKKELTVENKMWNRITERDGYVRYEINRDNPVLQLLFETIDDKEFDLLNTFISQIEDYLPKYTIHNDASDINLVIVNNDDNEEDKLIDQVISFSKLFPLSDREQKIKNLLAAEGYQKIANKFDEILKEAIKDE